MGAYFQNIELLETRSDNESALIIGGKWSQNHGVDCYLVGREAR